MGLEQPEKATIEPVDDSLVALLASLNDGERGQLVVVGLVELCGFGRCKKLIVEKLIA